MHTHLLSFFFSQLSFSMTNSITHSVFYTLAALLASSLSLTHSHSEANSLTSLLPTSLSLTHTHTHPLAPKLTQKLPFSSPTLLHHHCLSHTLNVTHTDTFGGFPWLLVKLRKPLDKPHTRLSVISISCQLL